MGILAALLTALRGAPGQIVRALQVWAFDRARRDATIASVRLGADGSMEAIRERPAIATPSLNQREEIPIK